MHFLFLFLSYFIQNEFREMLKICTLKCKIYSQFKNIYCNMGIFYDNHANDGYTFGYAFHLAHGNCKYFL